MYGFLCPLGVYYDDEGCILCGLCIAATKEEMAEAAQKMERYLKAQARKRQGDFREAGKIARGGEGAGTSDEGAE